MVLGVHKVKGYLPLLEFYIVDTLCSCELFRLILKFMGNKWILGILVVIKTIALVISNKQHRKWHFFPICTYLCLCVFIWKSVALFLYKLEDLKKKCWFVLFFHKWKFICLKVHWINWNAETTVYYIEGSLDQHLSKCGIMSGNGKYYTKLTFLLCFYIFDNLFSQGC